MSGLRRILVSLVFPAVLLASPAALSGCVRHDAAPSFPAETRALPVMTFAGDPACAGSWTLRHAVSLTLAEDAAPLSFTGLLRLDAGTASIHAVGLGGMGFTLFDLTVARDTFTARFLHPSVVRLPGAAGHIAAVLRRLWLGGPRGPLRRAVFSGYGDEALGPWPRRIAAEGDGFALEILLLEARANYP